MTYTIRHIEPHDHHAVQAVVDDWWGGRAMKHMLPKLFFTHFRPTSFILEQEGIMRAFLIGFISQTHPEQAYIHFVGVDPACRAEGFGRTLYQHFFETAAGLGCTEVRCVTSPVNKGSIAFHTRMGFEVLPGDTEVDGIAVTSGYDGEDGTRVLFRRTLTSGG
jgi:predicted GNAT superfamily acetyltransferase